MRSTANIHRSIKQVANRVKRPSKHLILALYSLVTSGFAQADSQFIDFPRVLAESSVSDYPKILSSDSFQDTENWSVHGQATYVTQQKNNFTSPYYGPNSLLNKNEGGGANSFTFSSTAFFVARLWHGGEFYYNPEMFEGKPFTGQLVGLGGFQNGELQKGSFANPVYYTARAFFRQTIGLGGETQNIESSANLLAGRIDQNRLVLSLGKFATLDFFDQNSYSHDPRTQFQNFSLFSMGAYSYAADTKGYTYGAVAEWYQNDWIVKTARLALPTIPNTQTLDLTLKDDYIDQIELTHQHEFLGQPGAVRALYYKQHAFMGNYGQANALAQLSNSIADITSVRQSAQRTWGYGLNLEQAVSEDIGLFARWSWNPGNYETQTVDISRSLSGGVSIKGTNWSRPSDTVGLGFALNGLAQSQITYLQQGGISPFIGDGKLNYKKEQIFESYYSAKIYKDLVLTVDFQRIANPAYNASRGPVNILGIRAHIEI
jgi:high affinity Mn2+ porin